MPLFFFEAWIAAFRWGLFILAAILAAAFLAGLFLALGLFMALAGAFIAFLAGFYFTGLIF